MRRSLVFAGLLIASLSPARAALSPKDQADLTAALETLSVGYNQAAMDTTIFIFSKPEYTRADWESYFSGYVGSHPWTDLLGVNVGYPVWFWLPQDRRLELQHGIHRPLRNCVEAIVTNGYPALGSALMSDPEARATLIRGLEFLERYALYGIVDRATQREIHSTFAGLVTSYPAFFYKPNTLDVESQPYVGKVRASIYIGLMAQERPAVITAAELKSVVGLQGTYAELFEKYGVLVIDNNYLDGPQLQFIDDFLASIPFCVRDMWAMVVYEALTSKTEDFWDLWRIHAYYIGISAARIGAAPQNPFPDDVAPYWSEIYCLWIVHEANHMVEAHTFSSEQLARRDALIADAGTNHLNYIPSQAPDGHFLANPGELFAAISNRYFANTALTFELGRVRFTNGYRNPIDQFVWFADVYSQGTNRSYWYECDTAGNLMRGDILLTRNGAGHIDSIALLGLTDAAYEFDVDAEGDVTAIRPADGPPMITGLALIPTVVYTDDDVTAVPSGWTDPEGDPPGYHWKWYKDAGAGWEQMAGATSATLTGDHFARGDRLRVQCTPYDGKREGFPLIAETTVQNTPPEPPAPKPTISPASPKSDEDLRLSDGAGSTDADEDPITYEYQWSKDNWVTAESGQTLPEAKTTRGEQWTGRVRAYDGTAHSIWVDSDPVTIANTPPTQPTVGVKPDPPKTTDDLTCAASGSTDADGDPVTLSYRWYKDGAHQAAYDDQTTIPASATTKGEVWKCVVTPNDGTDDGTPGEGSARVANTPPTQPTVDVKPDVPRSTQDLTVSASGSTDDDGDTVTFSYRWYRDGAPEAAYDDQTTVPASTTTNGEVWKCVATPNDGTDDGPSGDDEVTVQDPVLEWAGTAGHEADGIDPDTGDPNSTTFTFRVKYTDPTGAAPTLTRCLVHRKDCGKAWQGCATLTMTKESGDIATGAIYSASAQLPNATLKYRFRFRDGRGAAVPGDPNIWLQGPLMSGVPHLCWTGAEGFEADGVAPDSGPTGTTFLFRVLYADSAGDEPTTHQLVVRRNGAPWLALEMSPVSAGNHRFGKVYRTSLRIDQPGNYRYHFAFADASGNAKGTASGWQPGPTIGSTGGAALTSLACIPTNVGIQLTFALRSSAKVTATVLNVAGRPIKAIVADRPLDAGLQTLLWDRRADTGLPVPAGLYLIRVTARDAAGAQTTALATVALR